MNSKAFYQSIDQLATDFASQQIEIFHWLHQHPELATMSLKPVNTSRTTLENSLNWKSVLLLKLALRLSFTVENQALPLQYGLILTPSQ
jgi:hypothetical protein